MVDVTEAEESRGMDEDSGGVELVFSCVGVASRNLVFVTAHPDDGRKSSESQPATYVLRYHGEDWDVIELDWPGPILAVRASPLEVNVIGIGGEVLTGDGETFREKQIDNADAGPRYAGYLRGARYVGAQLFAVGMSRQAYCRDDDDREWRRIDQAIRQRGQGVLGLEAVDGFSETDVYMVGLGGEMFRYDGTAFRKLDSPTTFSLRDVRCGAPNRVFACGPGGVLLQGSGDHFLSIDHKATDGDFYSIEWFRDALYVASLRRVYRLEDARLVPLDFGHGTEATAGHLHAADGTLWSCGAKHLSFTQDGTTWTPVRVTL